MTAVWSLAIMITTFRWESREVKKGTEGLSYLPQVTQEGTDQNLDWSQPVLLNSRAACLCTMCLLSNYCFIQGLTKETSLRGIVGILIWGTGYKDDGRDIKLNKGWRWNPEISNSREPLSLMTWGQTEKVVKTEPRSRAISESWSHRGDVTVGKILLLLPLSCPQIFPECLSLAAPFRKPESKAVWEM